MSIIYVQKKKIIYVERMALFAISKQGSSIS